MSLDGNLQDDAELFAASVRLQSVATGLNGLLDGKTVDERDIESFGWAGNLVGQMDLNSEHYRKSEHPELTVIATRLRPRFYGALLKHAVLYGPSFSDGVYETLVSFGRNVRLNTKELGQACQVIQSMATDILAELQRSSGSGQI